ncbi:MAG: hypothetical protein FWC00_03165 [Firmicutes bacterium]|nr:hypothetical protein [Bacillota bacterium]
MMLNDCATFRRKKFVGEWLRDIRNIRREWKQEEDAIRQTRDADIVDEVILWQRRGRSEVLVDILGFILEKVDQRTTCKKKSECRLSPFCNVMAKE